MERTITRQRQGEFCQLHIRLQDGRLSLSGTAGQVLSARGAKREARAYWQSYFEDAPEQILDLNRRFGRRFTSAAGAARFVVETDGAYHGLDVVSEQDGRVLCAHSCGQIREQLAEWFPEAVPYFRWHLNDMHAECEHQEARGESYQTHPDAECFDEGCDRGLVSDGLGRLQRRGYKIGSAWTKRELPREVVRWAKTFGDEQFLRDEEEADAEVQYETGVL